MRKEWRWQWYWMPTAVLLIGVFSITLLVWVNHISERQRINSLVIEAIMAIQINVSTGHLWLEEAVSGDATAGEALADMERAISLANTVLNGGRSEHGLIPEPLKDPQLRVRAEAIRSMLMKFKTLALERLRNTEKGAIASILDQQFDTVFKEILGKASALEDGIERNMASDRTKSVHIFLYILIAWTFIITAATAGLWNREKRRKTAEEALLKANEKLLDTQEELHRSEKQAMLGQIAGNMGNELRNPLGVMNNAVYFLESVLPDADETVREYLEIIRSEIDNSQSIISDLCDFCQNKPRQPNMISIHELIPECLEGSAIPENIRLLADLPESLPPVRVDPLQMGQVFRNLIANAVQAMPDGGSLHVRAREVRGPRNEERGNKDINLEPRTPNLDPGFIEISIIDTGTGIAPENMTKLFQPLFTTKSRGIGLGLAISQKLTEANGGRIEVESRLGDGATFKVTLPVVGE